jgi:hypothetical protein
MNGRSQNWIETTNSAEQGRQQHLAREHIRAERFELFINHREIRLHAGPLRWAASSRAKAAWEVRALASPTNLADTILFMRKKRGKVTIATRKNSMISRPGA